MTDLKWFYANLIFVGFSLCVALFSANELQSTLAFIFAGLWAFVARINYVDAFNSKKKQDEKYDEACKLLYNILLVENYGVQAEISYRALLENVYDSLSIEQQMRFNALANFLKK